MYRARANVMPIAPNLAIDASGHVPYRITLVLTSPECRNLRK